MSLNASAFCSSAPSSASSAGISRVLASSSAARCTALGNTSLDDWPMLTWSFAWTPSPARAAITSLAFMFDDVPDPVWKTSMGNWSSTSPLATRSPAAAIRSARSRSSLPSSALVRAAAALMRPSQRTTPTGTRSPETGKFSTAFVVSPPQSCSPVVSCVAMEPSVKPNLKFSPYLPAALRERPFALLFAGETVSSLGNWMFVVALPFAALHLHATAGQLGLVLAARHVPFALFALVAGAWGDRFERRRLLLITNVIQGACQGVTAALLLAGTAQLWELAVLVAVYGSADAFFYPALIGLVPAAA